MILKRHESKSKQQSTDAESMLPVYRTIMDVKLLIQKKATSMICQIYDRSLKI